MKNRFFHILPAVLFAGFMNVIPTLCAAQNFIPQPQKVIRGTGTFTIRQNTVIVSREFAFLATSLNEHLGSAAGLSLHVTSQLPESNYIYLSADETLPDEGYVLDIQSDRINITGKDRVGIFYALQTLFQMMPPEVYSGKPQSTASELQLPVMRIDDYPRFAYRGVHLDVSRTFFDKETVMKYIDWMSRHKINKFHWHLTDDNGWRIEIKKYPELTAKGAWRGPGEVLPPSYGSGSQRYGGFYTQEDIREVVRYALVRNVEIIPEIDLPGHSQALIAVFPETFCKLPAGTVTSPDDVHNVLCVAREENYAMLKDIFTEIAALFPSDYIHIGGDEVSYKYWRTCPHCQALMKEKGIRNVEGLQNYFTQRLEEIMKSLGKKTFVWNEAIKGGSLPKTTAVSGWETLDACVAAIKAGYPTVMMPATYMYLDMKQSAFDRGHTWAGLVDTRRLYSFDPSMANLTAAESKLVMGVEAPLWAELLDRPERFMEYQAYPCISALAEVGWSDRSARNWSDFYRRLTESHLDRLAGMGIAFRMFPANVTYVTGKIEAVSDKPGVQIRYTTDFSEPNMNSMVYTQPIYDKNPERYRFRTFYKTGHGPSMPPISQLNITLKPNETRTINIPLKEHVDKTGIWLLSLTPNEDNVNISRLEVTGGNTPYVIIRNGQKANPFSTLRIYITDGNIDGTLSITLRNGNAVENPVVIGLTPSMYIEPAVRVSGTLSGAANFPFTNIADYNFTSYSRTTGPCKKGDYMLYTFTTPFECSSIDVRTGIPNVTRYIITDGYVEYSADGATYTGRTALDEGGAAMIYPAGPVKTVRISINGSNGEPLAAFQDLRITKKY